MITSFAVAEATPNTSAQTATSDPPSLRRRAPRRIDLILKSGQCPSMTGKEIQLRAGQSLVLGIVLQTHAAQVEVATERPLQTIVSINPVGGGPVPAYHAEFSGQLSLPIIPIPRTGKLHITIIDGLPDPCRIIIPITIRPGYSAWVVWWLLAFLGIVGLRLQKTVVEGNSVGDVLTAIWTDFPYLLAVLALCFLLLIPLWFLCWLLSLAESAKSND